MDEILATFSFGRTRPPHKGGALAKPAPGAVLRGWPAPAASLAFGPGGGYR
jgi:hypothetical protein